MKKTTGASYNDDIYDYVFHYKVFPKKQLMIINKNNNMKKTTGANYNDDIYDYVFHYNIYKKEWSAIHRDDYQFHFNALPTTHRVIKSSSIDTCIELINKGEAFVKQIK